MGHLYHGYVSHNQRVSGVCGVNVAINERIHGTLSITRSMNHEEWDDPPGGTRKKTMEFQRDPFNLLGFIGVLRAFNDV